MRKWIVIGVETGIDWPSEETAVRFRGRELVLRPETDDLAPSVVIPYEESSESYDEAAAFATDFLSCLCWTKGRFLREKMWTGGSVPINVGKGPIATSISMRFRADHLPEPADEKARLALALYREAMNVNSVAYQFLGYFKIINILHSGGAEQKAWINGALPHITDFDAKKRITDLHRVESDLGDYLYTSGRCAVAHAFSQPVMNPDDPTDRRRLATDLCVIKALAEHAIESEFGVQSASTVFREHLYELDGFRRQFGDDVVSRLKNGAQVGVDEMPKLPLLGIRLRDEAPYPAFESLVAEVIEVENGQVFVECNSQDGLLRTHLALSFVDERLGFDPCHTVQIQDDGTTAPPDYAIGTFRFIKRFLANGEVEVWDVENDELLGRCDPFLPVNIRPDAIDRDLDQRIAECQEVIARREAITD